MSRNTVPETFFDCKLYLKYEKGMLCGCVKDVICGFVVEQINSEV